MFKKKKTEEIELKPKGTEYSPQYEHYNENEEVELKSPEDKMNALFTLPGVSSEPQTEHNPLHSKLERVIDQNEKIISLLEELLRKRSDETQTHSKPQYYEKPFEERRLW